MDVSKWRHTESWTYAHGHYRCKCRKVDDMIRANRRITIDEVAEELGISHERAQTIIHDISSIQKSVSTMGAPTIDLDTPGTTHAGQPGTSRALP
ncbi:HTH_48 domain-containing protein [Trichonephila clavata]|uniref:HTH_48 domain-containing protein n=1 Tax=Trichonephila clavata TaxID=2740835 RepID=A0A8X6HJU3_TRICU|nr:HTH_48 domain-containing protein [Trichonephila clavata]